MKILADDFGPFEDRTWLNCAHQGPLPRVAVEAAEEALRWKVSPHHLDEDAFYGVPRRLKEALGRMIGASREEIILGNSTSYGIHLLANGLPLRTGDEILLVKGDYPANILPWLELEKRGVKIYFLEPESAVPDPEEIVEGIESSTKVFCTSWVNSFNGHAIDIQRIGRLCRERGVVFIVNGSQALGARVLDVSRRPVDVFTCCGFKWLCGPYGTGFCWIRPDFLESLDYNQAYWLTMQQGRSLDWMREYRLRDDLGASKYDVYCTANFLNFMPWTAALEYLLSHGVQNIEAYDSELISYFNERLDKDRYRFISPQDGPQRSTLIIITYMKPDLNPQIIQTLQLEGIDVSLREGNIRISPHVYNTSEDLDRTLSILNKF